MDPFIFFSTTAPNNFIFLSASSIQPSPSQHGNFLFSRAFAGRVVKPVVFAGFLPEIILPLTCVPSVSPSLSTCGGDPIRCQVIEIKFRYVVITLSLIVERIDLMR